MAIDENIVRRGCFSPNRKPSPLFKREIVTDPMHNFGLPTYRNMKVDQSERTFETRVLEALENIERRLSAVERDSHKQVTMGDLSETIKKSLRANDIRTRKFC